jgi:hypothetical protein
MARAGGLLSGRIWKIVLVSLALLMFAVTLPLVASAEPSQPASADSGLRLSTLPPSLLAEGFEGAVTGWTTTGDWAVTHDWQPGWGSPNHSFSDSPVSSGNPGGNYADNLSGTASTLTSPAVDLSASLSGQVVQLMFSYNLHMSSGDGCFIDFWNGSSWVRQAYTWNNPTNGSYFSLQVPAPYYVSNFRFRLGIESDASGNDTGLDIDLVNLVTYANETAQEDDLRIAYYGNWSSTTDTQGGYGAWTYKRSNTAGDLVQIAFTGTGMTVYGRIGPSMGYAVASVDGVPSYSVDCYTPEGASAHNSTNLFSFLGLSDGPHVITMMCSGTKNPASTGYGVSLDRVAVWGSLTTATGVSRVEQDDGHLYLSGPWTPVADATASGGSLASVGEAGGAMNVSFNGSYLALVCKKGPGYGKAPVSLDGATPFYVDLYNPTNIAQQRVYNTGLLTDGPHTLSIYWVGEKNPAAWGNRINVDAFDLLGMRTVAPQAPPITWRYSEADPKLTYLGKWGTTYTWSASGGTYASASQTGAAVVVSFTGPGFKLMGSKGPDLGQALVTVDGGSPNTVDFYRGGSTLYKQTIWEASLVDGPHTVVIQCAGTKNLLSSGYSINVDSLDLRGYLSASPTKTRLEQTDSNLGWEGTWSTAYSGSASSGNSRYADSPGAAMNVSFSGTSCTWLAKKGPGYGKALVVLDLLPGVVVDLYSAADSFKQAVYTTGVLSNISHSLTIYWLGSKNAAAWGTKVDVDAFDVLGSAVSASGIEPIEWRYQQNDSRITYLGNWTTGYTWSASGGSFASTATTNAAAMVKFKGTEACLVFRTAPWYGQAEVTLDGTDVQTVDLYSATTTYKRTDLWSRTGLSPGEHTLTIKCTGTPSPGRAGTSISLDAIDVTGWLMQAPVPSRAEQDGSGFSYNGTWGRASTASASGGSYDYTNDATGWVEVEFTGRYLAWVAKTCPWYGKAEVTLVGGVDGVSTDIVTNVDLYSAVTGWQKTVFNTGLLDEGVHHVKIRYLGTKYYRSTGSTVNIDGVNVIGSL